MRLSRSLSLMLLGAAGVVAGCGGEKSDTTAPPKTPVPNFIELQSDVGDYIGAGQSYTYTQANAYLVVSPGTNHISIGVTGDESWSADFQGPDTLTALRPATYAGLQRYPFNDPATGGMSWSGEGRGCNTLTGSFTIDSLTRLAGAVTTLDFHFEQHCEGAAPALRGTIHWRLDDTTGPAGPVNPPPAGLWKPAAGSTPSAGSYVYLESEAGDYIGSGSTYTYVLGNATNTITSDGAHVRVAITEGDWWYGDFQAMSTLSALQPGYYGGLRRYPFHNPAKGGLAWSGQGRGCNTLTGWFVVDRATYLSGALSGLDLRFEQHCEGGVPALHGAIHWSL